MSARTRTLLLLLLPGAGYLLVFFGAPLVGAILGSLTDRAGNSDARELCGDLRPPVYVDGCGSLWLARQPRSRHRRRAARGAAHRHVPGQALLRRHPRSLVVPSIVAAFVVLVLLDRGGLAHRWLDLVGIRLPRLVRDDWAVA